MSPPRKQRNTETVALRYARMLERGTPPFDHELVDLLTEMNDALQAATAYVELYTANGVAEQPPQWAQAADGFDAELIAKRCRSVLRNGTPQ